MLSPKYSPSLHSKSSLKVQGGFSNVYSSDASLKQCKKVFIVDFIYKRGLLPYRKKNVKGPA